MNDRIKSHLLAAVLMSVWGLSYISIKVVVAEINPLLSALYRFIIAAVILYIFLKIKYPSEKILKEDKSKMALGGLFGVGFYFFFENYSVQYTTTSNVAILLSTIPVFTLAAQYFLFKEKITAAKLLGASLSVIGIIVIIASKERVSLFSAGTLGDLMALGAALCWVVYNLINGSLKGSYKSITITTHQAIWGCLFLSPSLLMEKLKFPSLAVNLNLLFLGIMCSCIGYVVYIYCLDHLGATVLTTYINLQPIITIIAAAVLIHEKATIWQLLGSAIIISGVFLVSFGHSIKQLSPETIPPLSNEPAE